MEILQGIAGVQGIIHYIPNAEVCVENPNEVGPANTLEVKTGMRQKASEKSKKVEKRVVIPFSFCCGGVGDQAIHNRESMHTFLHVFH